MHRRCHSEGQLNVNSINNEKTDLVNEVLNRRKRAHRSLDESHKKKVNSDKVTEKALLPKRHVRCVARAIYFPFCGL